MQSQCRLNAKESEEVFGKLQETELQLNDSYSEIANLKIELSFHKSAAYSGAHSPGGKIEHVHSEDSDSNNASEGQEYDPPGTNKTGIKAELEKAMAELAQLKIQQERNKQETKTKKSEISELKQVRFFYFFPIFFFFFP